MVSGSKDASGPGNGFLGPKMDLWIYIVYTIGHRRFCPPPFFPPWSKPSILGSKMTIENEMIGDDF
jgi:hypothetical protein